MPPDAQEAVAKALAQELYGSQDVERLWICLTPTEQERLRRLARVAITAYVSAA